MPLTTNDFEKLEDYVKNNRLDLIQGLIPSKRSYYEFTSAEQNNIACALRDAILLTYHDIVTYILKKTSISTMILVTESGNAEQEKSLIAIAISTDNLEIIRLLIEHYKKNKTDDSKICDIGLSTAIDTGNVLTIDYLLQQGANADASFMIEGNFLSYLAKAALDQKHEIVDSLIHYGASIRHAIHSLYNYYVKSLKYKVEHQLDKVKYQDAIKILLDFAVGVDLIHDESWKLTSIFEEFKFLDGVNLAGMNLIGLSYNGFPITRSQIKHFGGAQSALLTLDDLNTLKDLERKEKLKQRINHKLEEQHGIIEPNGIINLIPLWLAAQCGNIDTVKVKLDMGVDPNEQGPQGDKQIPIVLAAQNNHKEIATTLLTHRFTDKASIQKAALTARANKHSDIEEILTSVFIERQSIDELDNSGEGLIHKAINSLDIEAIESLIVRNADLNLKTAEGNTALSLALKKLERLNNYGAEKEIIRDVPKINSIIELLVKNNAIAKRIDLSLAVKVGASEIVNLLLAYIKDTRIIRKGKTKPWYLELIFEALNGKSGTISVLAALHHAGADFNHPESSDSLNTLLHHLLRQFICYPESLNILKFLLEHSANPQAVNAEGFMPLHDMLQYCSALWFVEHDTKNKYPPDFFLNIIGELQKYGFDINSTLPNGESSLHIAAREGYTKAATALVSLGANIHHMDNRLNTPLHNAAKNGQTEIVKLLVSLGAEVTTINNEGLTPLQALNASYQQEKKARKFYSPKDVDDFEAPYNASREILMNANKYRHVTNQETFFNRQNATTSKSSKGDNNLTMGK